MNTLATPSTETALGLQLTHPTPLECQTIWDQISVPWRDALSHEQFMEECAYLLTVPLAKDGGMTLWILVEEDSVPDQRAILASCESFRKRALVSTPGGGLEDVIVHGIASVFCEQQYRGNGYPKRMLNQLARVLQSWQVEDGERCVGSILYSDIGKKYYADLGWKPTPGNHHIEFPAQASLEDDGVWLLVAEDLEQLCQEDEKMIRNNLAKQSTTGKQRLMIIPDHDHMLWQHNKEEFVSNKLLGKIPLTKGAMIGEPGKQVWAIWTHRFYGNPKLDPSSNVLYILRLVMEDVALDGEKLQLLLKKVFQSAQAEAAAWNLSVVKLWDPHPRVLRLVRRMAMEHTIVDRDEDGIGSLLWYGEKEKALPEWVGNEKYAWC